jgi:hypothetical protein
MRNRKLHIAMILPVVFLLAFSGEEDFHKVLQEKLNGYYYRNMPVKLNFFFNQSQYAPGDTVYYRIASFTAQDHEPVRGRQIINIVVKDQKRSTVYHQKALVEDGWGKNQFVLPSNLQPGVYVFAGYSYWMQNTDSRMFSFNKLIVTGTKELALNENRKLAFYPEGGSLAKGVNNKVVATGTPGTVVNIVNNNGGAITSCTIDRNGLGMFYLTPRENESYTGITQQERVQLPDPGTDALSMVVTTSGAGRPMRIAFENNEANGNVSYFLSVVSQRKIYYSAKLSFSGKRNAIVSIPTENLLPGLSLITVFKEDGTQILNRIVFVRDFDQAKVKTNLATEVFSPRQKVSVTMHLSDSKGQPVQGRVSVSVQDSTVVSNDRETDITRGILLSDLPLSALGPTAVANMDDYTFNNFLITQQWLRFSWDDVMKEKTYDKYPLQANIQFSGKVIHPEKKLFGDSSTLTIFLQKDVMVYQAEVHPDGRFDMPVLFDFDGIDEAYYRVETKRKTVKGATIIHDTVTVASVTPLIWNATSQPSRYGLFAKDRTLIENAYKPARALESYTTDRRTKLDNIREEYFVADTEVNLSDYLYFPTMSETFREVIPFVSHRVINKRNVLSVYDADVKTMSNGDPVYIIDGVMTDDTDYLLSLEPRDVISVKVLSSQKNKNKYGPIGRNGVLIIATKIPGNARNVRRSASMFYATGISPQIPFLNTNEKTFQSRVPVLKSCLFWNPEIRTDADGKATFTFYTTDNTGDFTIVMDGLTINGEPIHSEEKFKVRFSVAN